MEELGALEDELAHEGLVKVAQIVAVGLNCFERKGRPEGAHQLFELAGFDLLEGCEVSGYHLLSSRPVLWLRELGTGDQEQVL